MMDQNIINLNQADKSHDGQRHPETYRPMDADKWSQYFKDIIDTFPEL